MADIPIEITLATLSQRFFAFLIDAIPMMVIFACIRPAARYQPGLGVILVLVEFAYVVYQAVLLSKLGQSIGKRMIGIQIHDIKTGRNGGFESNVLKRAILSNLLNIIPFYALVDVLFIFRRDRRCIHDFIAGTHVVQV